MLINLTYSCFLNLLIFLLILLIFPFVLTKPKLDKTDFRKLVERTGATAVFAPIPYGPFEIVTTPYAKPGRKHWLGADEIGRDVAARMIYGARASQSDCFPPQSPWRSARWWG